MFIFLLMKKYTPPEYKIPFVREEAIKGLVACLNHEFDLFARGIRHEDPIQKLIEQAEADNALLARGVQTVLESLPPEVLVGDRFDLELILAAQYSLLIRSLEGPNPNKPIAKRTSLPDVTLALRYLGTVNAYIQRIVPEKDHSSVLSVMKDVSKHIKNIAHHNSTLEAALADKGKEIASLSEQLVRIPLIEPSIAIYEGALPEEIKDSDDVREYVNTFVPQPHSKALMEFFDKLNEALTRAGRKNTALKQELSRYSPFTAKDDGYGPDLERLEIAEATGIAPRIHPISSEPILNEGPHRHQHRVDIVALQERLGKYAALPDRSTLLDPILGEPKGNNPSAGGYDSPIEQYLIDEGHRQRAVGETINDAIERMGTGC